MRLFRNARRAILLTLSLLSACAAADPSASTDRAPAEFGSSGNYLAGRFALNHGDFELASGDLLKALAAERFRELIARRGLTFSNCDGALRAIALGVCDYLSETAGCPSQLAKMPLEGSIISAIEDMFREGSDHHTLKTGVDPELLATAAAWAIFGAARGWYQTPDRIPAEEMAAKIEAVVKPVFLGAAEQF